MAFHELTPDALTFQSFKHSQGTVVGQRKLLSYVLKNFDILPNTTPGPEAVARYGAFLRGSDMQQHIRFTDEKGPDEATRQVLETFKQFDMTALRAIDQKDWGGTVYDFATTIIKQEIDILGQLGTWKQKPAGQADGKADRRLKRVASGKASYLLFYGRDQGVSREHSTGYRELDALYSDSWDYCAQVLQDGTSSTARYLLQLENLVYDTEQQLAV